MLFYKQFRQLFHVSEPRLSKQFFPKLEFLFSVLASMVSKTSVNCVTNWKMPKSYPNSLGYDKINLDVYYSTPVGDLADMFVLVGLWNGDSVTSLMTIVMCGHMTMGRLTSGLW